MPDDLRARLPALAEQMLRDADAEQREAEHYQKHTGDSARRSVALHQTLANAHRYWARCIERALRDA